MTRWALKSSSTRTRITPAAPQPRAASLARRRCRSSVVGKRASNIWNSSSASAILPREHLVDGLPVAKVVGDCGVDVDEVERMGIEARPPRPWRHPLERHHHRAKRDPGAADPHHPVSVDGQCRVAASRPVSRSSLLAHSIASVGGAPPPASHPEKVHPSVPSLSRCVHPDSPTSRRYFGDAMAGRRAGT